MRAARLSDSRIRIPTLVQQDGAEIHGTADIGPDDPRYAAYDAWLRQEESQPAVLPDLAGH